MIVFDAIVPNIQLDLIGNQNWVNDTFYIKPIFDATMSHINTFYFFERDALGCIHGLLGEWNCQNAFDFTGITRIKSYFKTLIADQMLPEVIISELYETIGKFTVSKEISLFMWTINKEQDVFNMVSKNFNHALLSKNSVENGRLKRFSYNQNLNQSLEMHREKFSDIKQVILPTNSYGIRAYEQFETNIHKVREQDVYKLAGLFKQSYLDESHIKRVEPRALIMDFESFSSVKEYTMKGLESHQNILDKIMEDLPLEYDAFSVKLVYSELVANAYMHGNQNRAEIPIKIIVSQTAEYCYIEVFDLRNDSAHIIVPTTLNTENILSESGRGLFLVNSVSEFVYVGQNSTTAKLSKKGGLKCLKV